MLGDPGAMGENPDVGGMGTIGGTCAIVLGRIGCAPQGLKRYGLIFFTRIVFRGETRDYLKHWRLLSKEVGPSPWILDFASA